MNRNFREEILSKLQLIKREQYSEYEQITKHLPPGYVMNNSEHPWWKSEFAEEFSETLSRKLNLYEYGKR